MPLDEVFGDLPEQAADLIKQQEEDREAIRRANAEADALEMTSEERKAHIKGSRWEKHPARVRAVYRLFGEDIPDPEETRRIAKQRQLEKDTISPSTSVSKTQPRASLLDYYDLDK